MISQSLPRWGFLALFGAPLLALSPLAPCTTFCLFGEDGTYFGRNYDWHIGVGLVVVNKRGLVKTAQVPPPEAPATWTSKFGSVTFNQYGREYPMGGLNEAGLVVEQMWLSETRYPGSDDRAALGELAWIQYQLDNCRSVEEVLATDSKLRVTETSVPLHFLIADRSGATATIEFLAGEMVAHHGDSLAVPVLANSSYASSMDYLETLEDFGGSRPLPKSEDSLDRFARAACGVLDYGASTPEESVAYAFDVLASVSQGEATRWSIVYDIDRLAIHFRTEAAPAIKTLRLADFDLSAATPCRILDIDTPEPGRASERFVDYTTEANQKLIFASWKNTEFVKDTPDEVLRAKAAYPESIVPAK